MLTSWPEFWFLLSRSQSSGTLRAWRWGLVTSWSRAEARGHWSWPLLIKLIMTRVVCIQIPGTRHYLDIRSPAGLPEWGRGERNYRRNSSKLWILGDWRQQNLVVTIIRRIFCPWDSRRQHFKTISSVSFYFYYKFKHMTFSDFSNVAPLTSFWLTPVWLLWITDLNLNRDSWKVLLTDSKMSKSGSGPGWFMLRTSEHICTRTCREETLSDKSCKPETLSVIRQVQPRKKFKRC